VEFTEAAKLLPEDKRDLIVRQKSHEIKPMFVEDAIEQMEMLGHDFFFFLNAETEQYNVGSVNHRLAFCAYPLDLGYLPATASMIEASECMLSPFDDHPVARFQVQND
jgi:hypothetical protein